MRCDLARIFGALAQRVPTDEDAAFVFDAAALPGIDGPGTSDALIIRKGEHGYQGYSNARVDMLLVEARKPALRHLGLALLARLFRPAPVPWTIALAHPASDIRMLVLDHDPVRDGLSLAPGYETRPLRFTYRPTPRTRYPLAGASGPAFALPGFNLTNAADSLGGEADWRARDVLRCAGSDVGHVQLAALLLDLGRPEETCDEATLESGALGNGGVAPGSPELRFVLPGSFAWSGVV